MTFKKMKIAFAIVASAGLLMIGAAACGGSSGARGPAPDFKVSTFGHGEISLEDLRGQPVVLNFWFPSCPPCRTELPEFEEVYQQYQGTIEFIGIQQIGLDTIEQGMNIVQEFGLSYPIFADVGSKVQVDYGVIAYPTTIFIDKDGNIRDSHSGLIRKSELEKQVQSLLSS